MLVVVVPLQDAPGCAPTVKLEPYKKTGFVKLLAVDDFSLHRGPLVDGCNFEQISRLPTMGGADANALGTEVVGVGFFFDFAHLSHEGREADYHHDRQSLFRSSGQILVKMHTFYMPRKRFGCQG